MKKIINDPSNVVEEMVTGLARMYPQYVERIPATTALVRSDKDSMTGKVGLVSGGGSGHEPAHAGYVGKGMLTALFAGKSLLPRLQTRSTKPLRQPTKARASS